MIDQKRASTVLVIDDEPIIRLTLGTLLEGTGYRVEMAENGEQGLEKAREIHPDVILLDVMMPGMDGYEVCRKLREDSRLAEVPIFMITALDDRSSRLAGLAAGADDFLSKPFDSLELEIRLNALKRVDRYRHLLQEREKLKEMLEQASRQNEQLRQLSKQVILAQENERRRLALELHDEVGQIITGLKLILEQTATDPATQMTQALGVTNELMRQVREISLDLRPTVLDDFGLCAALDWLFKRFSNQTGVVIHHNVNPLSEQRFEKAIETAAFRVTQEALTNLARHAGVKEANVTLSIDPASLILSISDAGKGFELKKHPGVESSGVSGMAERVSLAGGHFSIQSTPGKGTLITAEFNLDSAQQ